MSDDEPEEWLTINETCRRFRISRATFYRTLADTKTGLAEVVVRVPPPTGRIRVPRRRFEAWLWERQKPDRRSRSASC